MNYLLEISNDATFFVSLLSIIVTIAIAIFTGANTFKLHNLEKKAQEELEFQKSKYQNKNNITKTRFDKEFEVYGILFSLLSECLTEIILPEYKASNPTLNKKLCSKMILDSLSMFKNFDSSLDGYALYIRNDFLEKYSDIRYLLHLFLNDLTKFYEEDINEDIYDDFILDLHKKYKGIIDLFHTLTYAIKEYLDALNIIN